MVDVLKDSKLYSKAPFTTNINLVRLAETGIEYIPVSWLGSSRVGFAVVQIIERSHASQSISIITKLVQLGNFVRSSEITAPYFLSLTSIVTDVKTRWFKSLFGEYWNLMCAVCQVDMGAPSVGDYADQSRFSSIASLAAPSKSMWFVRIARLQMVWDRWASFLKERLALPQKATFTQNSVSSQLSKEYQQGFIL